MKYTLVILLLTATAALAQIDPGTTPTFTNNVPMVLNAAQKSQVVTLYREATNAMQAAWQALGDKPAPPVLPSFAEWFKTTCQDAVRATLISANDAYRQRMSASAPITLVQDGWPALTPAQRLSISNTLQTAVDGR